MKKIIDETLSGLVEAALEKVCKATGRKRGCLGMCEPQIPEDFVASKDVAVFGRSLDGDLDGKDIKNLANDENNKFAIAVEDLLTQIYGAEWNNHVIYSNVALISEAEGGSNVKERITKPMFDAQYNEMEAVYAELMTVYRPRITFLFIGNTSSESVFRWIPFNKPIFAYYDTIGYTLIDTQAWETRFDGVPFTITLYKDGNGLFFCLLEMPGRAFSNKMHSKAILEVLRRNAVI